MWVIWKRWFVVLSLFNELQLAKGIAINDSIKFMHGWLYGPVVFNFSLMISNVSQFVTRAPLTMRCFLLEWLKYPLGKCSNKNLVKSNQHRSRAMRVAVRPKHPSAIIMVIWPVCEFFFLLSRKFNSKLKLFLARTFCKAYPICIRNNSIHFHIVLLLLSIFHRHFDVLDFLRGRESYLWVFLSLHLVLYHIFYYIVYQIVIL